MWRITNTTSKLGLPSYTLLKNQHGTIRENRPNGRKHHSKQHTETTRGHGDLANRGGCDTVLERGRKGRKDLELLIWELALRFEPHNISLVQKATQSCSRAESCKLAIPLERRETFQ